MKSGDFDSRGYADKLGKQEQDKGTKGWDGSPLSDSDARLYGLRGAGYMGPIDQDGYMGDASLFSWTKGPKDAGN